MSGRLHESIPRQSSLVMFNRFERGGRMWEPVKIDCRAEGNDRRRHDPTFRLLLAR